ncbi:hypothetical protein ACH40E_31315 [Streptomyces acidicola]|uniref:hypothetical protein n=1 Tax=Streptomyces acidicola TaxID=2596892 RepID=UPI0037B6431E
MATTHASAPQGRESECCDHAKGRGARSGHRRSGRSHRAGRPADGGHEGPARAEADWFGPRQAEWFTRLRREHGNLRPALRFCLDTEGEAAAGLALAITPRHYWLTFGSLSEGRHWLSRLLDAERAQGTDSDVRAPALCAYAYLGMLQGAAQDTLPVIEEARSVAERHGDRSALAWTRHPLGALASFRGELTEAATLFDEALTAFRELGDQGAAVQCAFKLAITAAHLGDLERATALCRDHEAIAAAHGDRWVRGLTVFARSLVSWHRGETGDAARRAREAIRLMPHPTCALRTPPTGLRKPPRPKSG